MALGHQCKEVREGESESKTNSKSKDKISQFEIDISLYESERLRQLLLNRLEESGWRRRLRDRVQNLVYNMPFKKLTIEDIVQELAPKASSTIPEDIKKELLMEAKKSTQKSNVS
jgi:enhancer of yellow 2 transcription factor